MDHTHASSLVQRLPDQLTSDDRRVIPRYLSFGEPRRIRSICARVAAISPERARQRLVDLEKRFSSRHRHMEQTFRDHYHRVSRHVPQEQMLSSEQEMLIGAYFTMEYSIEAAALFNPSIVPHPDQDGVAEGSIRFLMSLRATGEGHVSSIVFRRGVIDATGKPHVRRPARYACTPRPVPDRRINKADFFAGCATTACARNPSARCWRTWRTPSRSRSSARRWRSCTRRRADAVGLSSGSARR